MCGAATWLYLHFPPDEPKVKACGPQMIVQASISQMRSTCAYILGYFAGSNRASKFSSASANQRGETSFNWFQSRAGYAYQKCSRGLLDWCLNFLNKDFHFDLHRVRNYRADSGKTNDSIPNVFVPTDIVRNSTHQRTKVLNGKVNPKNVWIHKDTCIDISSICWSPDSDLFPQHVSLPVYHPRSITDLVQNLSLFCSKSFLGHSGNKNMGLRP